MNKYLLIYTNIIKSEVKKKVIPIKVNVPKNSLKILKNLNQPYLEKGLCSYYHDSFNGKKTSTGDIFINTKWTCAHKTLPIPSVILVIFSSKKQIKGVKLLVNDRGPFIKNRIIDVSKKVAEKIGLVNKGVMKVVIILLKNETNKLLNDKVFLPIERILTIEEINQILEENN
jgi:rare lipoprotein A